MAAAARTLAMESTIGVSTGPQELRAVVDRFLAHAESIDGAGRQIAGALWPEAQQAS